MNATPQENHGGSGSSASVPTPPKSTQAAPPGPPESPTRPEHPFSAFGSLNQFKDAQRMAMMLAQASIVPECYRGEEHVGDWVIALEIANRIGASVLAVMQNLKMVQGKPGWSAQFLISCVNATKRFSPIRYQMTGTRGEDSWGCIAWAIDRSGQALKSPEVTIGMAKAEGWYDREGSKWKTMPELMLCYRGATLFTRLYAPEITMGIQTTEELADMALEGNGHSTRPVFVARSSKPRVKPRHAAEQKEAVPLNFLSSPSIPDQKHGETAAGSKSTAPETAGASVALTVPESQAGTHKHLRALGGLLGLSGHVEADVLKFLHRTGRCDESATSLAAVAETKPEVIAWAHDYWKSLERELARIKKGKKG